MAQAHAVSVTSGPFGPLQQRYALLLRRLEPHRSTSPFHGEVQTRPTHIGEAHVEFVDGRFNYVVTERGAELVRRVASDEDELLYWLLDDVAGVIAYRRKPSVWTRWRGGDPRRQRFATHLALLRSVDPAWAERKRAYYDELLQRYPFRDDQGKA
jgi:hypothetical protein